MTDPSVCVKCGQREVRVVSTKRDGGASIPIGFWKNARVAHHVCTQCGHVEMRITDAGKLAAIAKKWPRAQ